MSLTVSAAIAAAGGKAGVAALAMKSGVGILSYNKARNEGQGVIPSMAKGAFDGFAIDKIGPGNIFVAKALANAPSIAAKSYYSLDQQRRQMSRLGTNMPFQTANFMDTQQAYTMRQAGMKMAQQSQFSRQQAMLGNEAQFFG